LVEIKHPASWKEVAKSLPTCLTKEKGEGFQSFAILGLAVGFTNFCRFNEILDNFLHANSCSQRKLMLSFDLKAS
jgi:hypothetical protein